jgi:spore germination protein GerM
MDKKLSLPYTAMFITLCIAVLFGVGFLFFIDRPEKATIQGLPADGPAAYDQAEYDPADYDKAQEYPERADSLVTYLYFADKDNTHLVAQERFLADHKEPAAYGRRIIQNLIKGPNGELMRTVPEDTGLRALYVTQDKTAFVDLTEKVRDNHPGGVQSENNTIYSIVNSLVLNIPQIDKVKILIGGSEANTLAGHIDLRFPFKANMLIVR